MKNVEVIAKKIFKNEYNEDIISLFIVIGDEKHMINCDLKDLDKIKNGLIRILNNDLID